jgi:ferredoxin
MATIRARGKTFEVADGTRLVNAIEDAGIDILHRCGGNARCTTCRVTFNVGEPADYHPKERERLESGGNLGKFRLSCHILCSGEMDVGSLMLLSDTELDDPGSRPTDSIPE